VLITHTAISAGKARLLAGLYGWSILLHKLDLKNNMCKIIQQIIISSLVVVKSLDMGWLQHIKRNLVVSCVFSNTNFAFRDDIGLTRKITTFITHINI